MLLLEYYTYWSNPFETISIKKLIFVKCLVYITLLTRYTIKYV